VQKSAARARQPQDDHRPHDLLLRDLRPAFSILDESEARFERRGET
jgi:hypothetical protein